MFIRMTGYAAMTATLLLCISQTVQAGPVNATSVEKKTTAFSVQIGASRVIYHANSSGSSFSVSNPQDYPILILSSVVQEDKKTPAPFLVTPPLLRLDAKQQSRIRVIRTGGNMPADREKMQWLCVKALPPVNEPDEAKANTATIDIKLSISSCSKLLFRPQSVKGQPEDVADSLTWSKNKDTLTANNPTPFYMNFASVKVGKNPLKDPEFVAPHSTKTFTLPGDSNDNDIEWKIITDYGGESRAFQTTLK